MNNLKNNYCEECDCNNLEINFKNYKNKKEIEQKKDKQEIKKTNFIPINLESLPKQYCNLCNEISHKITNCPLLCDNFNFALNSTNNSIKKTSNCFRKTICHHFSNFTLLSGKSKKVSFDFNLSTTH
jgi:hypothetical protein